MDKYHIVKMEALESVLISTIIGFINPEDKEAFEAIHGCPMNVWANENPNLPLVDYFDTNSPCYLIDSTYEIQEGLSLIINLNEPE